MTKRIKEIRAAADRVVSLAAAEDVPLANLARRVAIAHINHHGWYAAMVEGRKTFYQIQAV